MAIYSSSHKTVARLAGSLAAIIALAGPVLAQDTVTLRLGHLFQGANTSTELYKGIIDTWVAAHPEVNLIQETASGDDHRMKLSTDLAADNVPDIFYNWAPPNDVNKFVEAGIALDMNEYFAKSTVVKPDNWTPEQLEYVMRGDEIVMLPTVGFKCFTLYNTELFTKYNQTPPKTWDELLAVSKVFNEAGITPVNIGSKGGNPGHLLYNVFLGQLGGQSAAEALKTNYSVEDPTFREAAMITKELIDAKVFPSDSVGNGDWPGSINLYNVGQAAMVFTCPWMVGQIKPEIAAVSEPMFFPAVKGATVDATSFHVGNINNGWMANKESFADPKKQAAMVSLLDALNSDVAKKGQIELGLFPAWKAGDLSGYTLDPLAAKIQAFTATAPDQYPVVASLTPTAGALTAYLEAMDKLFAGQDPTTVFDDFQTSLDGEKP